MIDFLINLNFNYPKLVDFFISILLLLVGLLIYILFQKPKSQEGVMSSIIKPHFIKLGKCKILAIHEYEFDSKDSSGLRHLKQYNFKEEFDKLIKQKCFLIWHKFVSLDSSKVLTVVISRNGREKEKCIYFNH